MIPYVPALTWHAQHDLVQDGVDLVNAANKNAAIITLADNARVLQSKSIQQMGGARVYALPISLMTATGATTTWRAGGPIPGDAHLYALDNTPGQDTYRVAIPAIENTTLVSVGVLFEPPGGHGALPATQTHFRLYSRHFQPGADIEVLEATSNLAANVGEYEVKAWRTATPATPLVFGLERLHYILIDAEHGANSAVGSEIYAFRCIYGVTP